MTRLLDLPTELLTLIIEEIGGGELRRDVGNLTICRKWYECAYPVFFSGQHTRNVDIYGCNINRLSDVGGYPGDRKLMHKNTRNLFIRLVGHWRDNTTDVDYGLFAHDETGIQLGKQERALFDDDPYVYGQRSEWDALTEWHTQTIKPRLLELFRDLHRFTFLENFTFETSSGMTNDDKHIHGFLSASETITTCLTNLPLAPSLRSVTLDFRYGYFVENEFHLCGSVAKMLPKVQEVRIRMSNICPQIFQIAEDIDAGHIRLKRLIVKLHLPAHRAGGPRLSYIPIECTPDVPMGMRDRQDPGGQNMVRAARTYVGNLSRVRTGRRSLSSVSETEVVLGEEQHGLELFRISYVDESSPLVHVVNCLTLGNGNPQKSWPPGDFFAYQDYGTPCWFEDDRDDYDKISWGAPYTLKD